MSELRIESATILAAPLGADNPLPSFETPRHQALWTGRPEDDTGAGYLPDYLPYAVQDGYTRERRLTDVKVAVLENDRLRATFLLDYGGRMWSLVHKPSGRELLYVNPILQFANLATRNAWFSGGVEWNVGIMGHTPFTCSPLFAARVDGPQGTPVLRMYEWERVRQVAYQIDAYLPDSSPVLYVRCRIVNPFDHAIPMYWWSNMAVPERDDVRVLAPTDSTFRDTLSSRSLSVAPVPIVDGQDITYTTRGRRAADYFFRMPPGTRPWISALDAEGKGLIQVSTDALQGRKLFLWGTGSGGKRWQEWLSGPGHAYLEIQAGLAPTQLEYVTMPPRAEIAWLEAYGLMEAEPRQVHGDDWTAARADVSARLEHMLPRAAFEAEFQRGAAWADQPPDEMLHRGSGWGELELLRRQAAGERPFAGQGLDFSGALGEQQRPWLELLRTGRFPDPPSDTPSAGTLVQSEWRALLEEAVRADANGSWEAWLRLGEMRLHDGDADGARQAWINSLARNRNAWTLRNLALRARLQGRLDDAASYYRDAVRLRPDLLSLLVETGRTLIDAGSAGKFLHLLETLPDTLCNHGRIHLLEVEAGLAVGDLERVGRLLAQGFEIVDYREGDEILTELWVRYHAERLGKDESIPVDEALLARARRQHPLPSVFDFRMMADE